MKYPLTNIFNFESHITCEYKKCIPIDNISCRENRLDGSTDELLDMSYLKKFSRWEYFPLTCGVC